MTGEEFKNLVEEFYNRKCKGLMQEKSSEYARGKDKLHNFKKAGRMEDESPEAALKGMQLKHRVSISDMLNDIEERFQKEGPNFTITQEEYNKWEEKLGDDINYDFLLLGLLRERLIKR